MWAYRLASPMNYLQEEVATPSPESLEQDDVLLRFLAGGICGSDMPRYRHGSAVNGAEPIGRSLHEIVGEVVASNSDLAVGERAVGWVVDFCGLAEYVKTSARELLPVPAGLDPVHAVAMQPLACVLAALSRVPNIAGARTAVIGLGPIGVLFTHALKDLGAATVVGVDLVDRSDVGAEYGIDELVHASSRAWARTASAHDSFDLIVEAVGHQVGTLDDAISMAAQHGTILYFGVQDDAYYPVRVSTLMDKNIVLRFGRTPRPERREALRLAAAYVAKHPGLLERYVTERVPVSEAQAAYQKASRPAPGQLKIVLDGETGNAKGA
jgi:L-iditol 2-dehydrogenase